MRRIFIAPNVALVIAIAAGAAFCGWFVFGFRVALLAAGDLVLVPAAPVSLYDSLPALEGGLTDLEAYTLAPSPGGRADPPRAVWWAPAADSLVVEFYTERRRLDSTTLFVWSDVSGARLRTLRRERAIRWVMPLKSPRGGWEEIVGVYRPRPAPFTFRIADSSVRMFERVEGRALHRVRGGYFSRWLRSVRPDTTYPAPSGGELELFARGSALAVVNPGEAAVRLGVIRTRDGARFVCRVRGHSIQVYRELLRDAEGPVLAYTNPGSTKSLFFRRDDADEFFWLEL